MYQEEDSEMNVTKEIALVVSKWRNTLMKFTAISQILLTSLYTFKNKTKF